MPLLWVEPLISKIEELLAVIVEHMVERFTNRCWKSRQITLKKRGSGIFRHEESRSSLVKLGVISEILYALRLNSPNYLLRSDVAINGKNKCA